MATLTPKLQLRKPDTTDLVNVVTDVDENYDKIDKLSAGELAFAEVVVNQGPITAAADLVSAPAITTIAGQRILIQVIAKVQSTVAGDYIVFYIKEGATQLQLGGADCRLANVDYVASSFVRLAPAAGAHTYKLQAARVLGTGVVTITGSTSPTQILVTDLGRP